MIHARSIAMSVLLAGVILAGCCVAVDPDGWPIVPAGPGHASWFLCWDTPDPARPGEKHTTVGMPHAMPPDARNVRGLDACVNPRSGDARGVVFVNIPTTPLASSASERGPAALVHDLKVWPPYWAEIDADRKRVEIRKDDRLAGVRVGDVLRLREYDPDGTLSGTDHPRHPYTGRVFRRAVTHVLRGGQFGLAFGFVALSLGPVAPDEPPGAPDDPVEIAGRILLAKGGLEEWCVFTGGPHPGSCGTWEEMVDRAACEDYRRAGSGIAVRVTGPWRIVRDCPVLGGQG